jgi:DUF1009 family protein
VETIGLIAGNGTFPLLFATEARRRGYRVVAVAHRGETPEAIDNEADEVTWVRVGQLGRMLKAFKKAGIQRAVMAGGINKVRSLADVRPDLRGIRFLGRAVGMGDDALLRQLAAEFEGEGIHIVPSTLFLERMLAREGLMAGPPLSKTAREDVELGRRVMAALGPLDIGQGVVVERGLVLAIEAIEGTDAAVRRAGALGRGGAVVVKMAKRGQDMRFDVPAVGPTTIETMREAKASVLALEAGRTLILEEDKVLAAADAAGVTLWGMPAREAGGDGAAASLDEESNDG